MVVQTHYSNHCVNSLDNSPPERPPKPQRDDLNGLLDVYLAQSVKEAGYRERLIDILGVIDRTSGGRAVLEYFRERARENRPLAVNLLAPGTAVAPDLASQDLWLPKDVLTAPAPDIGVTPEEHYAPAVFHALLVARNARVVEQYTEQTGHDLAETHARFVKELAEQVDAPSTRRTVVLSQQALQATREAMLNAAGSAAGSVEKPDVAAHETKAVRRASMPVDVPGADKAGQRDQSLPQKPSRSSSAQASLNGQKPDAAANDTSFPGQPDPAETEQEAPSTSVQTKKRRFRAKWISRRFDAFTTAVIEWKNGLRRSRKADTSAGKTDASLYFDPNGVPARKPSSSSTTGEGQA
ncbi:hypothetical protein BOSP111201_10340 [Bordetella sputigena]|uniref:hypothetical protein n=1 Tax=Bordetella sputigena TaxID=1416810 RepID=UPI0039F0CDE0